MLLSTGWLYYEKPGINDKILYGAIILPEVR
jgi:hypothetical protein